MISKAPKGGKRFVLNQEEVIRKVFESEVTNRLLYQLSYVGPKNLRKYIKGLRVDDPSVLHDRAIPRVAS